MMSIKADRVRLSHRGPFRSDCGLVPSSETWSGWKDMACDTEVREGGERCKGRVMSGTSNGGRVAVYSALRSHMTTWLTSLVLQTEKQPASIASKSMKWK